MIKDFSRLERRFLEIESLLSRQDTASDQKLFRKLSRERAELETGVNIVREITKVDAEIQGANELIEAESGEMADLAREELHELQKRREDLINHLRLFLLPKDPNDERNIYLEIRAGAGGDEASLFAYSLFRMYSRYCERNKLKIEITSVSENELSGFKEVVAYISGENVYKTFKYESGVHRVQRVPQTETQGRVHTSTVTVAILPEVDELDEIEIKDADIRVDTYRAGGAGGQHVNRTDSAVRLTHLASGIVVTCQDERSQIKNKAKAMALLKSKLYESALLEKESQESAERKSLVGRGDRSERIRTYNFPQSRLTDHRVGYTTHALSEIMEGALEDLFDNVHKYYQLEALKAQEEGKL